MRYRSDGKKNTSAEKSETGVLTEALRKEEKDIYVERGKGLRCEYLNKRSKQKRM